MPPRYAYLLADADVGRWHANLAKGSVQTGREYLRALGQFSEARKQSPKEFVAMGQRACEDALHDYINQRLADGLAGSSANYHAAVVQSWMEKMGVPLRLEIKIPVKNYNPKAKKTFLPTREDLGRVVAASNLRQRVAISLIAYAGIRPGAIGNFTGDDGLMFSDIPDAHFEDGQLVFDTIPARIVVRAELNKSKHEYFTMLGQEACDYLSAYVRYRVSRGEKVGPDSALVRPQRNSKFLLAESVGKLIARPMKRAKLDLPAYIWRSYFSNRFVLSERDGVARDYKVFFMGHRGDIEMTYSMRKRLPADTIAQMRDVYARAARDLEVSQLVQQEDSRKAIYEALLQVSGLGEEEVKAIDTSTKTPDELLGLARDAFNNTARTAKTKSRKQRAVRPEALDALLEDGWTFVQELQDGRVLVQGP